VREVEAVQVRELRPDAPTPPRPDAPTRALRSGFCAQALHGSHTCYMGEAAAQRSAVAMPDAPERPERTARSQHARGPGRAAPLHAHGQPTRNPTPVSAGAAWCVRTRRAKVLRVGEGRAGRLTLRQQGEGRPEQRCADGVAHAHPRAKLVRASTGRRGVRSTRSERAGGIAGAGRRSRGGTWRVGQSDPLCPREVL
jgi:hypothetical protein